MHLIIQLNSRVADNVKRHGREVRNNFAARCYDSSYHGGFRNPALIGYRAGQVNSISNLHISAIDYHLDRDMKARET